MILVLLGTNPYPFNRLLQAVDTWAAESGEQVIAQTGHTECSAKNIECHDFVPHDQIEEWVEQAELVITQGGFGSLRDCLVAGKPTIGVPRMREYGECQDEQIEVVKALAEDDRVIALYDVDLLSAAIDAARHMTVPESQLSSIPRMVAEAVNAALGTVQECR